MFFDLVIESSLRTKKEKNDVVISGTSRTFAQSRKYAAPDVRACAYYTTDVVAADIVIV